MVIRATGSQNWWELPPAVRKPVCAIASFGVLVALSAAGTEIASGFHLPVPGALLGTVALALWLTARPRDADALPAASALLRVLPLLFVPLVVEAVPALLARGSTLLPMALIIAVSTVAAIVTTVAVSAATRRLCSR